jgi:hypothetical protein
VYPRIVLRGLRALARLAATRRALTELPRRGQTRRALTVTEAGSDPKFGSDPVTFPRGARHLKNGQLDRVDSNFQSYAGALLATRWSIGRTTRYAADCLGPCTPGALVISNMTAATYVLDLTPPGSAYYERLNQLDVGFRKIFRIERYQFSAQADIFNIANVSYVKNQQPHGGIVVRSAAGRVATTPAAARGADEILREKEFGTRGRNIRPVRAVRSRGTAAMRASRQPCDGDAR